MSPILDRPAFIRRNTRPSPVPQAPEITLYMADDATELWQKTETDLGQIDLPPPFWAFAWAGGQALARYLLDHPETVRGARVLDFASGSGLVADRGCALGRRLGRGRRHRRLRARCHRAEWRPQRRRPQGPRRRSRGPRRGLGRGSRCRHLLRAGHRRSCHVMAEGPCGTRGPCAGRRSGTELFRPRAPSNGWRPTMCLSCGRLRMPTRSEAAYGASRAECLRVRPRTAKPTTS